MDCRRQLIRLVTSGALLASCASGSKRPARANYPQESSAGSPGPAAAGQSSPQLPGDSPLVYALNPDLPPAGASLVQTAIDAGMAGGKLPAGAALSLPAGFHASVYASPGGGPRLMALSPDGHVFVTLQSAGQVVELTDSGMGTAVTRVVVDGLRGPHGIAFFGGYLYVGETNEIVRFPSSNGQVDTSKREVIVPNLPTGGHSTRTVVFGPDGLMYVAVGSSCNVCIEQDDRRAAISVYNPDGSGGHLFATGLRNAVGLAWQPGTGYLWATVNGRDNIGQDMGLTGADATRVTDSAPPDYTTRISSGGNYGWPRCYADHELDPRFGDAAFCASTLAASIQLQAHSAPLGLAFYTGTAFPADYQGDLFVAFHGSWNRSVPTGYKIVRVKFAQGQPVRVEDFVTGWNPGAGAEWSRPVDVLVAPDGSLLISDDTVGLIFRISYTGS